MRFSFICLLLLAAACASAQRNLHPFIPPDATDRPLAVTFSPLALLQFDYSFVTGAEYVLSERVDLVADVGYTFASIFLQGNSGKPVASGFLFRPGVKFYTSHKRGFYIQPQVFFKQVTHRVFDWLDKDVNSSVPWQQLQDFRYRRQAVGGNAIFGRMREIGRSDRFYADAYIGFGVRYRTFGVVGEKNSRYDARMGGFLRLNEPGWAPSLPMGLRLVMKL